MHPLLEILQGEDRRSIGRSAEARAAVQADPALAGVLVTGLTGPDPIIAMRAADALEKATAAHPDWLQPYASALLGAAAVDSRQEVRWHLAQMLPRLQLNAAGRRKAMDILVDYLEDPSSIVKTCAMQALAELSLADCRLRGPILPRLKALTESGTPAMRARGRKLLKRLGTD